MDKRVSSLLYVLFFKDNTACLFKIINENLLMIHSSCLFKCHVSTCRCTEFCVSISSIVNLCLLSVCLLLIILFILQIIYSQIEVSLNILWTLVCFVNLNVDLICKRVNFILCENKIIIYYCCNLNYFELVSVNQ